MHKYIDTMTITFVIRQKGKNCYNLFLFYTENIASAIGRWLDNFAFQAVANAFLSVDTFFFLR